MPVTPRAELQATAAAETSDVTTTFGYAEAADARRPAARSQQAPTRQRPRIQVSQGRTPSSELATTPPSSPVLPVTSFTCKDKVPGGYYADIEADCQLFHICSQGRHGRITDNKFMCGPGTRFNQQSRTCQARELVDCSISASLYHLNDHFQLDRHEDISDEPGFEPLKVHRSKRQASDAARIPDYTVDTLPKTSFTCEDKPSEGLYADVETRCQGFHLCQKVKGVMSLVSTFVCPYKTVFNQREGNCDSWADVDCNLYSQPEHSFDRKGPIRNPSQRNIKRDTNHVTKSKASVSSSNDKTNSLQNSMSYNHYFYIHGGKDSLMGALIVTDSLVNYRHPQIQSEEEKVYYKIKQRNSYPQPSISPHKLNKRQVSEETDEEYYDYINDNYEADPSTPEQENSNSSSKAQNNKHIADEDINSYTKLDDTDITTTILPTYSAHESVRPIPSSNLTEPYVFETSSTLSSVSLDSEHHDYVKGCTQSMSCNVKDNVESAERKEKEVNRARNGNNTDSVLYSEGHLLVQDPKNNKTPTPLDDGYEYYDYYIEDSEEKPDEIITFSTETPTLQNLQEKSLHYSPTTAPTEANVPITQILESVTEETDVSAGESFLQQVTKADMISEIKNKSVNEFHNSEKAEYGKPEKSVTTFRSEIQSRDNHRQQSTNVSPTLKPEMALEDSTSAVDEIFEYYDADSYDNSDDNYDVYQDYPLKTTSDKTSNLTEKPQKHLDTVTGKIDMKSDSFFTTNETKPFDNVTYTSLSILSDKHTEDSEISSTTKNTMNYPSNFSALYESDVDNDTVSVTEADSFIQEVETELPETSNKATDEQYPSNFAHDAVTPLLEHTTQLQKLLRSNTDEEGNVDISSYGNPTPYTMTVQNTSPTTVPNLFHPPKTHNVYHGRHSTPLLPPVVIRSKDAAVRKSPVRLNRHKTKKAQTVGVQASTESLLKSENGLALINSGHYFSPEKQRTRERDEKLKTENNAQHKFQLSTFSTSEEITTTVPLPDTDFLRTVTVHHLDTKSDIVENCKLNSNCSPGQSHSTTLSPLNEQFSAKHSTDFLFASENEEALLEPTNKPQQKPNSLDQSTLVMFTAKEERPKPEESSPSTDIPPTSSGNSVDFVTITPKFHMIKTVSDIVTTELPSPMYTLSVINAQSNEKPIPEDNSRFVCSGKELYHYYQDPLDCRIFHYCSHGFHHQQVLDFKFMCDNGTAFSIDTQKCENEEQVQSCFVARK